MKDATTIRLRDAIVEVLSESRNDTTLGDLLQCLKNQDLTDQTAVKAALWQLIADGEIELTSQRTLRLPREYENKLAAAM